MWTDTVVSLLVMPALYGTTDDFGQYKTLLHEIFEQETQYVLLFRLCQTDQRKI